MVQSFRVGKSGRVWITTAEALTVPGFGRPWVAARLTELRDEMGARAFQRALRARGAAARRRSGASARGLTRIAGRMDPVLRTPAAGAPGRE